MTDEQIIKALECCQSPLQICKECPMPKDIQDDCKCMETLAQNALNLINRQKAEIERLMPFGCQVEVSNKLESEIKSEAIKEFAERVKEKTLAMVWSPELFSTADYIECIDSLVKETVGEQYKNGYARGRAEAITEYHEEVKKRCIEGGIFPAFVNRQMEDVRKEMVGE